VFKDTTVPLAHAFVRTKESADIIKEVSAVPSRTPRYEAL
jgi:hypothetical protein